ncbi:MAG TPA: hypothetical protein VML75_23520 [Kofleriaceae bacterium]|nr:hypothetical protein [Kofleriaceae bacterium]
MPRPPELDRALANPEGITELRVRLTSETRDLADLVRLPRLRELTLYGELAGELPAVVSELPALDSLALHDWDEPALPEALRTMTGLRELTLVSASTLDELPAWLGALPKLQRIEVVASALTRMSIADGYASLESLRLDRVPMVTLPAGLWALPALTEIELQLPAMTSFPGELGKSRSLARLDIHAPLVGLPEALGERAFGGLRELRIIGGTLPAVPGWVGEMNALESLSLFGDEIEMLSPQLAGLSALEVLDLGHNQLATLPAWVGVLTRLRTLLVPMNRLTSLPDLSQLTRLERLDVSTNPLRVLPASIGELSALETLHASNCQLDAVHERIAALPRLRHVRLARNRLRRLPAALLARVSTSDVEHNPLPTDTLRRIVDYYQPEPCPRCGMKRVHLVESATWDYGRDTEIHQVFQCEACRHGWERDTW